MLKKHVFSLSINTGKWIKAAAIRAVRTSAQAAAAGIGAAAAMGDVNWKYVLSVAGLSGLLSILTSLAGIPECASCGKKTQPEEEHPEENRTEESM